jgi:hypothetical protein
MKRWFQHGSLLSLLSATVFPAIAFAEDAAGKIERVNSALHADGTISATAAAAMRGPLPMGGRDLSLKRAANRAADSAKNTAGNADEAAEAGGRALRAAGPTVVDDQSFLALSKRPDDVNSPVNVTGAIGPTLYIQAANSAVRLYNRRTNAVLKHATLNALAGHEDNVTSFNPQIIWDATTERFYYVMNSVFSDDDNRLSIGFSKTGNPRSLTSADWCNYVYTPENPRRFPDSPKLGDSRLFLIIGVNSFGDQYLGSDIIAIRKPDANVGTECPDGDDIEDVFRVRTKLNIQNRAAFSPVPANQIDNNAVGYVVARNGTLPSDKLWFFSVTANRKGAPVIKDIGALRLPEEYDIPPDARQPDFSQVLETLDARPTQAVQAINPARAGNVHSFWTQHTVKHPDEDRSVVRWYEINPAGTPTLLRNGEIGGGNENAGRFFFNAAISPDRRVDRRNGSTIAQFGKSFVIHYNVTSRSGEIVPRIAAGSSVNGAKMTFRLIKSGVDSYRDDSCPESDDVCRWSSYASASPDPRPTTTGRGEVWGATQFADKFSKKNPKFRTWIFALSP